jgi:hypothetical protein
VAVMVRWFGMEEYSTVASTRSASPGNFTM